VDLETSADVAILRLAAGKANAMSQEFLARLNQLLDRLAASPARAAVIIGTGKAFSAGLDLPSLIALSREAMRAFIVEFEATMLRVFRLERPLVAAVNGHAIAGGCVLALQADARVAAAGGAKIGLNETSLGIGLPAVVLETLRCQVPPASLVPIALEGRLFSVDEAKAVGLIDEVVDPAALEARAIERARALGAVGSSAFAQVKAGLRRAALETIERRRAEETELWLDSWFSAEAHGRLRQTVARLAARAP
jgi:enoyl-CoA hydratase